MTLVEEVYKISKMMPDEEKFDLTSQMLRAAVSIPTNIAEGSGRGSDKQMKQFLEYSLGSAFELETELLIADKVYDLDREILKKCLDLTREIQRMEQSFIYRLR